MPSGRMLFAGLHVFLLLAMGLLSGGPHLRFGVYQYYPPREGDDVPINFRNADGTPDEGGSDSARSIYRDGDEGDAAVLTIESRGETGAELVWPALRHEGSGK